MSFGVQDGAEDGFFDPLVGQGGDFGDEPAAAGTRAGLPALLISSSTLAVFWFSWRIV